MAQAVACCCKTFLWSVVNVYLCCASANMFASECVWICVCVLGGPVVCLWTRTWTSHLQLCLHRTCLRKLRQLFVFAQACEPLLIHWQLHSLTAHTMFISVFIHLSYGACWHLSLGETPFISGAKGFRLPTRRESLCADRPRALCNWEEPIYTLAVYNRDIQSEAPGLKRDCDLKKYMLKLPFLLG